VQSNHRFLAQLCRETGQRYFVGISEPSCRCPMPGRRSSVKSTTCFRPMSSPKLGISSGSGAHDIFLYWRRDQQFSNCLQRRPVQGKKACTRPYSTPLHTAKFPMQYRNDIRILDRGAPLRAPSIGIHCAHNAPGCQSTAPTLLKRRVRRGLSGAGWGHVELAGHPKIKKRDAAPTNGDLSRFPCGQS